MIIQTKLTTTLYKIQCLFGSNGRKGRGGIVIKYVFGSNEGRGGINTI
jgi:hypothetical protein